MLGGQGGHCVVKQSDGNVEQVHCLCCRYGKVQVALLRDLERVRTRVATGSAMASRISTMAWDLDRRMQAEADGP